MKLLSKILIILLWVLLIALILAGVTLLSWWMQWPLFTGAVIVFALIACFLFYLAAKAIWRWRDKRKFVESVSKEDAVRTMDGATDASGFDAIWKAGLAKMSDSSLKYRHVGAGAFPCFIVLDEGTALGAGLFGTCGQTIGSEADPRLSWHFLPSTVLLRYQLDQTGDDGLAFLTSLAKDGRKLNVRGIVVLLPGDRILREDKAGLAAIGGRTLSFIQQMTQCLEREFTVHVLVGSMQGIPGMADVLGVMDGDMDEGSFGSSLCGEWSRMGGRVVEDLARRIEDILYEKGADGTPPKGAALSFFEGLAGLGRCLDKVMEALFRKSAYGFTPTPGGMYFCSDATSADERPFGLDGFLSDVLPRTKAPGSLRHGLLPFYAKAKARLMAGWLLLCLAFCAILFVNALHQDYVLHGSRAGLISKSEPDTVGSLYDRMMEIHRLEKARQSWLLPTFGQDLVLTIENRKKAAFVNDVLGARLMTPILNDIREASALTNPSARTDSEEYWIELFWIAAAVGYRMEGADVFKEISWQYPLTSLNQKRRHPAQGDILLHALVWNTDVTSLKPLANRILSLFDSSFNRNPSIVSSGLVSYLNRRMQNEAVKLSQFWGHITPDSAADVIIPAAYTEQGYLALISMIDDIRPLTDNETELKDFMDERRAGYFRHYEQLWKNFLTAFDAQNENQMQSEQIRVFAERNGLESIPHMRLLEVLGRNLAPLREAKVVPDWVDGFIALNTVTQIALTRQHTKSPSRWMSLFHTLAESPKLMQDLRAASFDTAHMHRLFDATIEMQTFYNDVKDMLALFASREKSMALATLHFKSQDEGRFVENSLYAKVVKDGDTAFGGIADDKSSLLSAFKNSLYAFLIRGVTIQAANAVQADWETEVMSNLGIQAKDDPLTLFTDEKSALRIFINDKLKPFIVRRDGEGKPADWDSIPFPFTTDFLDLMNKTTMIAATPAKAKYDVLLCTQPTIVNLEAKELPDSTELKVMKDGPAFVLTNRNYAHNGRFQFEPKTCGKVTITVTFPSFTVTRTYATFINFLDEFRSGERVFLPEEFDNGGTSLIAADISKVRVRILPDNANEMLQALKHVPPFIPERIITVW